MTLLRAWARGTTTTYGYNAAGDLATVVYSDGTTANVTNTYDRRGRTATITQGSGGTSSTSSLEYNDANQLLTESYSGGPLDGLSVTNGYDQYLRRTAVAALSPSSQLLSSTTYGYDNASRLSTVTNGASTATYNYLANSPLVSQITFKQSGATRMTTSKQYDYLNRLLSISSSPSGSGQLPVSDSYQYNSANQRTRNTQSDGSYWVYQYDALGQVTSGHKVFADGTLVPGQQFDYTFDDIGNRTTTAAGGGTNGINLRSATYSVNSINQYMDRTVPAYADILGATWPTSTVTMNWDTNGVYRKGEYFRKELGLDNTNAPVWTNIIVAATGHTSVTGNVFVASTPESFSYDSDGNLTQDGRWVYTWDAENRLTQVESLTGGPTGSKRKVVWEYDGKGRRVRQTTYDGSSGNYLVTEDLKLLSDGWRNIAELNATNNALVRSYVWGLDLSGSMDGAGGVGGLLMLNSVAKGTHFYAYDGNGNVTALVGAVDGSVTTRYEYDAFGRILRETGLMAEENSYGFSTKRTHRPTRIVLYEFRPYGPDQGRFLSRDLLRERGGLNLYCAARNDTINRFDAVGLQDIAFPFPPPGEPPADLLAGTVIAMKELSDYAVSTGHKIVDWCRRDKCALGQIQKLKVEVKMTVPPQTPEQSDAADAIAVSLERVKTIDELVEWLQDPISSAAKATVDFGNVGDIYKQAKFAFLDQSALLYIRLSYDKCVTFRCPWFPWRYRNAWLRNRPQWKQATKGQGSLDYFWGRDDALRHLEENVLAIEQEEFSDE